MRFTVARNTFHRAIAISSSIGVVLIANACAPQSSGNPLADRELVEASQIYLGSDQMSLVAQPTSQDSEGGAKSGENGTTVTQATGPLSGLSSGRAGSRGSSPDEKPKSKPKPKPKPKPTPFNVEFILTKSNDISVGLTSDAPSARVQNDTKPFIPASITKVITTAVALKRLGEDFRFKTVVTFALQGSVASGMVIYADGDPTVEMDSYDAGAPHRMTEMAAAMKAKGVTELRGPMILLSSDRRLDHVRYAAGIPSIDMRECYGSLASSFNYQWNCAQARIHSTTGFKWESPSIEEFLKGDLGTEAGTKNSLGIEVLLSGTRVLEGFRLNGTYLAKSPRALSWKLPIGNASGWYADEFAKALRAKQVKVSDFAVRYPQSPADRAAAMAMMNSNSGNSLVFESANLAALAEATNKPSDNFLADALLKAVGIRSKVIGDDALAAGQASMQETVGEWLYRESAPDLQSELNFLDGAGLSSSNTATPRAFLAVLRQLPKEKMFSALWESLPTAGEDGTLADRMDKTSASGKVRGKTGTLSGAYQLVGYVPKKVGGQTEYIPFVILTSTNVGNREKVRKFQDALVVKIAESVDRREVSKR
jgi:D-alanyl-D-alanine carboxypeptidase/D-alanyl-D-alanine-endopeptidase (penicillin-binding protein 4)